MPSIYNHENNACWGIRRTSYNIFNEPTNFDLNTNKADSTDCKEVKIENFHGSSNGYYGYVPTRIESDDSCAMDTSNDEHNSVHVSEGQTVTYDVNSNFNDFWKRKRSHPVDAEDSCKRTKVEGMFSLLIFYLNSSYLMSTTNNGN